MVELIIPGSFNHYEIQNLKLYRGKYQIDFTENGEKDLDKIVYPNKYLIRNLPNMAYDLRVFFTETETRTQKTLMSYIKNNLTFTDLRIVDSQIQYGTFFNYIREYENSDLIDMHAYWDHPAFPDGHAWDRSLFTINNTPMIKVKNFGTLCTVTKGKFYNKPFTVSEYNHPFPNEHLHEKFALYGSWLSFHDYDAIYHFAYDQPQEKEDDYISGYFKMTGNPIDFAMSPYTVLAFRNHYVKKSNNYVKLKLTKGFIAKKMKEKYYSMKTFLEDYFYGGWNAIFEVQILIL